MKSLSLYQQHPLFKKKQKQKHPTYLSFFFKRAGYPGQLMHILTNSLPDLVKDMSFTSRLRDSQEITLLRPDSKNRTPVKLCGGINPITNRTRAHPSSMSPFCLLFHSWAERPKRMPILKDTRRALNPKKGTIK